MSKSAKEYLQHILDECYYISESIQTVESIEDLLNDDDKKRALVRSLEIIGEATKRIPAENKQSRK